MSTLVDHYLLQLRTLLPAKQRDDIAAELRESIRSTVEERERELGRALTDDEVNEVLRGFGHPMVVAGRYLPMQQLIGPDVFPLYWYVMQAVLIVITVIGGLLVGVALLTAPRASQAAIQHPSRRELLVDRIAGRRARDADIRGARPQPGALLIPR